MRFDWYAATILDDPKTVLSSLAGSLGGEIVQSRGMHGFSAGYRLEEAGITYARIFAGGAHKAPFAEASGEHTQKFVDVVRSIWDRQHYVTRADSCQDFNVPGSWERLAKICLDVADMNGLKIYQVGDWHRGQEGRTLYVGSRKSPSFVRLYEKGKQMRSENPGFAEDYSTDWVRLEAVVRPDGDTRNRIAKISPMGLWGFSSVTRAISERALGAGPAPIFHAGPVRPDLDRSLAVCCSQYGKIFTNARLREGSWDAFGRMVGKIILEQERVRAKELYRLR